MCKILSLRGIWKTEIIENARMWRTGIWITLSFMTLSYLNSQLNSDELKEWFQATLCRMPKALWNTSKVFGGKNSGAIEYSDLTRIYLFN